jgi:hypothetical protein
MKKNIGAMDKWIRVGSGALILVLGLVFKSWWGLVGLLPLVTGLVGNCPLYTLLGMSTCKVNGDMQKPTNIPPQQPPTA